MEQKKPWYKSKIALLGIVLGLVGLTDFATGWLTGQVSTEQIQVIQAAYPQVADQIKTAVNGNNYFGIITALAGFVSAIWRVWFTNARIS